ncbi:MAG TPA: putative zinc-binding protein [Chloroflexota bacterium]|nr:putative zinc-binding protein [Chloroflexota bacterium]HUM71322.1 putative zinc-binding protein [Chloroflexota bacterium]
MPEIRPKKVGIVACSGEEMAEGTVTRLAALRVLETLRPEETVTICLPLFLAGGEGDRAFARYYPTIAVDGCDLRCAARATEMYSGKPAASVVVTDIVAEQGVGRVDGRRHLNEAGQQAVAATAGRVAELVDELLAPYARPTNGRSIDLEVQQPPTQAACACGSGIPVQTVALNGQTVTLVALPLILAQFYEEGKRPCADTAHELLTAVQIYNPIPADQTERYAHVLQAEYARFYEEQEVKV